LAVALLATALAAVLGTAIGLTAGFLGGRVEQVLMRIVDLALAFPAILLVVLLVAGAGSGVTTLVTGIGISLSPGLARLARALSARESSRDYILASRLGGTRGPRILVQEILPNVAGPMLAQILMTLSVAAGFAAGLSYLGLGIQPPTPDWGYMVQAGQEFLYTSPSLSLLPAVATLIFVVASNFVGDDVRDALDPGSRT
jgi:ABC-type dipeptide/oligopeptide/nickel transport system permease subunit